MQSSVVLVSAASYEGGFYRAVLAVHDGRYVDATAQIAAALCGLTTLSQASQAGAQCNDAHPRFGKHQRRLSISNVSPNTVPSGAFRPLTSHTSLVDPPRVGIVHPIRQLRSASGGRRKVFCKPKF